MLSDQAPGRGERCLGRASKAGVRRVAGARAHAGRAGQRKRKRRGRVHGEWGIDRRIKPFDSTTTFQVGDQAVGFSSGIVVEMIEVIAILRDDSRLFFPKMQRCMFKPRVSPWYREHYT
ncbi:hypothetical protein ACV22V_08830 [Burkholderia sp. AW33-5]